MKRLTLVLLSTLSVVAGVWAMGNRETGSFSYPGVREIEIESATFDVAVQTVDQDEISLEIRNNPRNYTVYHETRGDRVVVWVEKSFSLLGGFHTGELILQVPASTEIDVETSTGDVVASGLTGDSVRIRTTTGSIQTRNITSELELRTTTGRVTVESSEGEFDVSTSTGSISLVATEGPVEARSSTGSQSFESVRGDIEARTTTGRIEFSDTEGMVRAQSTTGSHRGENVLLTDDSRFQTSTGRIEIDIAQVLESLEFDLESSTGSLSVGDDRSQRRLFLGGTGITVEGRSSTGSQRYY